MAAHKPPVNPYDEVEKQVMEESRIFRKWLLPILLKTSLAGRYVVLKHGTVQSDHETMKEAYGAAVQAFGVLGGFAIHKIEPERILVLNPRYSLLCREHGDRE